MVKYNTVERDTRKRLRQQLDDSDSHTTKESVDAMGDLSEIRLKWAEEKDVASIVGLVLELAEFERELESVKLSEEQMKRDLCDKHFVCVIAQNEREEAVGMALCHNRYSTWDGLCVHLEDLYVKPDYRQRGIGRLLIEACVKYTHGLGCKRLCWEVLDWNTNGTSKIRSLSPFPHFDWGVVCQDQRPAQY
jgi:GNAT superfamily N-acetyltransferase